MSELGQTRRFRHVRGTSALPPIATIKQTCRQVGSVPLPEIECCDRFRNNEWPISEIAAPSRAWGIGIGFNCEPANGTCRSPVS